MSTTLEQRQAVGIEAEPQVIRKPDRGPIWPLVMAAVALVGVVVAGVTFSIGEETGPVEQGGAYGIVAPTGTLQGLGIDQRAAQGYMQAQEQLAGSNAPTGTLAGLGTDPRIGQGYVDAAAQAGSKPPRQTDWWHQTTGTRTREGGAYDDALPASQVRDLVTTEEREG